MKIINILQLNFYGGIVSNCRRLYERLMRIQMGHIGTYEYYNLNRAGILFLL